MKDIYTIEQLDSYLSTLPLGTEEVQTISEFCRLLENRMSYLRRRVDTAARLLGSDMITECMDEE